MKTIISFIASILLTFSKDKGSNKSMPSYEIRRSYDKTED